MNIKRSSRWGLAAALCGVVVVAACEGENLFDADSNPFIQPQLAVFAPDFAFSGDTVTVSLQATAALNVQSITVVMRGAVNKDTLIVTPLARAATATVKIGIPALPSSDAILINAQALDARGQASPAVADTVLVFTEN